MQWWCFSQGASAWSWEWQAYPGVWLFGIAMAVGYARWSGLPPTHRRARRFHSGVLLLWIAFDWPLGPLGASYLASAHMVQFLLAGLIAPALLLLGLPPAFFERLRARPRAVAVLSDLTHPIAAFMVYNVAMTVTHWPGVVDFLMATQPGMFALDMTWLAAGLVFWWPLLCPVPDRSGFHPLAKVAYLGVNGILIRPPFAMMVFSEFPVYATYELAPPIPGTTALGDQQMAGAVMKVGQGWVMGVALGIVFYRWWLETQRTRAAHDGI